MRASEAAQCSAAGTSRVVLCLRFCLWLASRLVVLIFVVPLCGIALGGKEPKQARLREEKRSAGDLCMVFVPVSVLEKFSCGFSDDIMLGESWLDSLSYAQHLIAFSS